MYDYMHQLNAQITQSGTGMRVINVRGMQQQCISLILRNQNLVFFVVFITFCTGEE